jgi:molecular chaperone GrpE
LKSGAASPCAFKYLFFLENYKVTDAEFTASETPEPAPRADDAGQPAAAESMAALVAQLEAKVAAAEAEAAKARDDWMRAKAETENVRRRGQEDVAKAHRFGIESFASELLAVKDSLDASLTVENASVESYRQGVELTAKQLAAAFEKNAVKTIDPVGEKFDPHRHQAISQVESDQEPNTVVQVLQKGYLLHDRVLRPALVMVAKGKE